MSELVLSFDLRLARSGFSLNAQGGLRPGVTALFGHSGCGKTTLLRCLAGLEPGVSGDIRHAGDAWLSSTQCLPPHQRGAGLIFQDNRLFAHMSVAQNLEYGRKRQTGDGPAREEVISVLGLEALLERSPASLSGGEAQRVAIARALLASPRVLLMDEPLASLDYPRRRQILALIRQIPERFNLPVLYVTHARYEVLELADRVMLMSNGSIEAEDTVNAVFSSKRYWPQLGGLDPMVVWEGRVVARDNDWGLTTLATNGGRLRLGGLSAVHGETLRLRITARDVVLMTEPPTVSSLLNGLPVRVEAIESLGGGVLQIQLSAGRDAPLWTQITRQTAAALRLKTGQRLHALIRPQVLGLNH